MDGVSNTGIMNNCVARHRLQLRYRDETKIRVLDKHQAVDLKYLNFFEINLLDRLIE